MTYLELNLVTASRSVLCPIVWFWCWWKRPRRMVAWMTLALAYFVFTDHFDGQWAREYGLVSELGYWLDHGGDFLFYGVVVLTLIKGPREGATWGRRSRRARPAPGPTPPSPTPPPPPPGESARPPPS